MGDSLELNLYDLEAEVGDYAGFGLGARFGDTAWKEKQQQRITKAVQSGLRMVYFTQEMEGIPGSYAWSFLRPRTELAIASGSDAVALPEDFNGLVGTVIPASVGGEVQYEIPVVSFSLLYNARALAPTQTGRPLMAHIDAIKGTAVNHGSRYRLQVYPTTDADYTFQVWYEVAPRSLSVAFPHVYGGPGMAETFKAAVRAAYEQDFDNQRGPETERFIERLRAAIAADRKFKPMTVGLNLDRSDDLGSVHPWLHREWGIPLEVNGINY